MSSVTNTYIPIACRRDDPLSLAMPVSGLLRMCLPVLLLGTVGITPASAQFRGPSSVSVSYFGEYIGHAGIKVGAETPLLGRNRQRSRRSLVLADANAGGYYHRGNHTGLFVDSGVLYRFITRGGFKLETRFGAGYHRSFVDGPVFSVEDNGDIRRVRGAGQNSLMISWNFGLGKEMRSSPLSWHIRPGFFVRTPYNSLFIPHFVVEAGVGYRLNSRGSR